MRRAYQASGSRRFKVLPTPWFVDWTRDLIRLRRATLRHPLWRMRFPSDRLYAAGYKHRYGMSYAYDLALRTITISLLMHRPDALGRWVLNINSEHMFR